MSSPRTSTTAREMAQKEIGRTSAKHEAGTRAIVWALLDLAAAIRETKAGAP